MNILKDKLGDDFSKNNHVKIETNWIQIVTPEKYISILRLPPGSQTHTMEMYHFPSKYHQDVINIVNSETEIIWSHKYEMTQLAKTRHLTLEETLDRLSPNLKTTDLTSNINLLES